MGTWRRNSGRCRFMRYGGNIRSNSKRFRVRNGKEKSAAGKGNESGNIVSVGCHSVACRNARERNSFYCRPRLRIRLACLYLRASGVVYCFNRIYSDMEENRFVVFKRFRADMDGHFIFISVALVYSQHAAAVCPWRAARIYGGTLVFPSVCKEKINLRTFLP